MVRKLESYLAERAMAEADDRNLVSRSEERREKQRLETERFELATKLTDLKKAHLARLELPEPILEIIEEVHVIQSAPARTRAIKRLRAELRALDLDQLGRRLTALAEPRPTQAPDEQSRRLDRLMEGGDIALSEFVHQYPQADRARLRTLLRNLSRLQGAERQRLRLRLAALLKSAMASEALSAAPFSSPTGPEDC
jgi:ribosome-associated protein